MVILPPFAGIKNVDKHKKKCKISMKSLKRFKYILKCK